MHRERKFPTTNIEERACILSKQGILMEVL
jgi:hypothetical protein